MFNRSKIENPNLLIRHPRSLALPKWAVGHLALWSAPTNHNLIARSACLEARQWEKSPWRRLLLGVQWLSLEINHQILSKNLIRPESQKRRGKEPVIESHQTLKKGTVEEVSRIKRKHHQRRLVAMRWKSGGVWGTVLNNRVSRWTTQSTSRTSTTCLTRKTSRSGVSWFNNGV